MTQSLVINGKEYLPSNVLATRFKYTPDYIGKLAREEKILGTLIGRQWFIEPESLSVFLTQAEIAKKMRQEELRLQRKIERQAHQKKEEESRRSDLQRQFAAFAQTAVVAVCGLLLGGLGFVASHEGVGVPELASGAKDTFSFVASSVVPSGVSSEVTYTFVAASAEAVPENTYTAPQEPMIFATLPAFPSREERVASTSVEVSKDDIQSSFSDEIKVVERSSEGEMIVPVFRKGEGAQQFLLTPVNAGDQ